MGNPSFYIETDFGLRFNKKVSILVEHQERISDTPKPFSALMFTMS